MLREVVNAFSRAREQSTAELRVREIGTVLAVDAGIALARGLPDVTNEELVTFENGSQGWVVDLQHDRISIAMLDADDTVRPGTVVWRTERLVECPIGDPLLGRVVGPLGRPLDDRGPVETSARRVVERSAPPITARAPITRPLHTGLAVVDAMIPIGRGQRQLILGDRGTGKTSVALDTILHQSAGDVICVLCIIGQQKSSVAHTIERLRANGALNYTVAVVAEPDMLPGMRFVAPYSAMTIAESFAETGRDVLVVFDDLTQHARSYRELSLLLRRPPGREAFPGDIFYVHSRLLERATQLRPELGGGSITALPIVETEAEDLAAYIPTNIVSITDGQIYLSPRAFQRGMLPAVDVGRSVSRVGGRAQLPTYRSIGGKLKLAYAQYEELEHFARFGTRMDNETRRALEHGRRVRELLRQPQYDTLAPAQQILMLFAVTERLLQEVDLDDARRAAYEAAQHVLRQHPKIGERIEAAEKLDDEDLAWLRAELNRALNEVRQ